ncbi:hypothetical protein QVD17_18239 [Tagetes erecta]|uniref:AAA+ ATPase domain-containing protein n=1 Tax=Tagetes erecta TaxID=13708 RepID=A0AAD8KHR3_TARER|nr:hypothetical protein QVD17_18239 [Tagetes erecta]
MEVTNLHEMYFTILNLQKRVRSEEIKAGLVWKMDALMNATITPVVKFMMDTVKKHLGFWISSPKYVKDVDDKMKQLKDKAREVQNQRNMAAVNTEVVPALVEPWLKEVEKMVDREKSIPTGAIGCFNVSKRYKAGKRSFDILKEIEDLEIRGSQIKFNKEKISLAKVPSTFERASTSAPLVDGTHIRFVSRDELFSKALKSLQSNNEVEKMIALCGTGGVGKTTMMEQLKKAVEVSKMFDWIVKVVVGENNDAIALQQAIAENIGGDFTETTKEARANRLRMKFDEMSQQGQKKILIIVDDIWKEFDLEDVGLTNPLLNGFKILVTSRHKDVCYRMGVKTNSIFDVHVLSFEEANALFSKIVRPFIVDPDDPEYKKIGEDIVKKCGGLPIALKTIASYLRNRVKDVWKEALFSLQQDDLKHLKTIVHKVFEISYNNLETEDDKAIFLLSGLLPDDFNIRVEDLMRYGWGLKLFTDVHTLADARRRTISCVDNLILANLLTESETTGCVKMHDLMRAFVLSNFTQVKQASIVNHNNMSTKQLTKGENDSYERILLKCTGMSTFPVDFIYPNLSTLMLMDGYDLLNFPKDIYERMERLQVVSYENMHVPMLPVTFEHSTTLQTLCLRSCSFINDDISLLGSLSNLETLSFVDCQIRRLPSTIGKLKKLKLLDLTGCVHLRIDDGVFQNLSSLEELYMRAYKDSPIRFTKANYDELQILSDRLSALELEFYENKEKLKNMAFKKLERFRVSIGCQLLDLKDGKKYLFINTIQYVGDYNELLECKINEVFNKTEELHLQVNEMDRLENHSFSNLRDLYVSKCTNLTCLFTVDVASGLKRLERLTISECHVMRTLVDERNSRVGVIRFPKLNFMSLIDLPNMVSFWDNKIEFPEMVKLKLDGLPNFTSIYPDNHNTSEIQPLLNQKVLMPQLEKLDIYGMEKLKQIWSCDKNNNGASKLRKIRVKKCDKLVNLFPSNPLPLLNELEELYVSSCDFIEVLFNMELGSFCGTGELSKLRRIEVDHLGKLKELWRMKLGGCDIHINCFKDVESINIRDCSNFENIFTPTNVKFDLGALTTYSALNSGEKINDTVKGEISEELDIPIATYPSSLLHTCHQLQHLQLYNDERVKEVVFEMDTHQQPLLLPYLQVLDIYGLKEMSHVWKCSNWNNNNKFLHQPAAFQSPFQNLTNIALLRCDKIKYLFSPLMAKYLSNLKNIWIEKCDGIEEVISRRDDENENEENRSSSHDQTTTLLMFPHLDTLELYILSSLKRIDDESQNDKVVIGACWSLCQYPTTITIIGCEALSVLIPWYAAGKMNRLQELFIKNCKTMVEVFESELRSSNVDEGNSGTTLLTTPTITTTLLLHVPQLDNLKEVNIYDCDLLSHIFTFYTLETLKQLQKLKVESCEALQVIVKQENENSSSKDQVVFPRLEILELEDLPNLKGFFLGMNEFRWHVLDDVMIENCPQLKMFTHGPSKTPKLKYITTKLGKHSVECGLNFHEMINEHQTLFPASSDDPTVSKMTLCSFHNLVEIDIDEIINIGNTNIIPSNGLLHLVKLEKIYSRSQMWGLSWDRDSSVEEVFEVAAALDENESQQAVVKIPLPNLREMSLYNVNSLKYLWKSNRWKILEFPNLTTLSIQYCDELEHVFTCSMVDSLVQLQYLHISECDNIKVIVKKEEEYDVKVNEIMLPRLKSLKLEQLQSLKGFCTGKDAFTLPVLDTLQIKKCPSFIVFTEGNVSTHELKVIDTTFGMHYVKPDLNSFIKTKQEEGYKF